ncbi:MAG: acyltransferase [Proteobacteria bacterium]|nr:acyltransferase [Pseudomonadota bacterium]
MELNLQQRLQFARLMIKAFRFRRSEIPSMLRNFILFFVTTCGMRFHRSHGKTIRLGRNVRLQRRKIIKIIGEQAHIQIGDHSIVYENARLEAAGKGVIRIGSCGVLGDCRIAARESVSIGDRALISWNVFIQDYDSHPLNPEIRAEQVKAICSRFYPRFTGQLPQADAAILDSWLPPSSPVVIGNDVWIGSGVIILKGARIGDGCVVAGGSVVPAGEYPPRSLLAGNPVRIVRRIETAEVFQ